MHCHSLVEVADMFHKVCSTIIHGEYGLSEPPRKSPSLNSAREMRSGNLVECSTHSIISQAFRRWIFVSALMTVVLIIRERLTKRSPWSALKLPSSSPSEEKSELEGVRLHRSWRNFLFKWSISHYMFLASSLWERWLLPRNWLLLVWVVCTLPSRSSLCSRLRKWSWHWDPINSA